MSVMNSLSSPAASPPQFLRRVLWLDAATGAATGLLQVLLADPLAALLGLPGEMTPAARAAGGLSCMLCAGRPAKAGRTIFPF